MIPQTKRVRHKVDVRHCLWYSLFAVGVVLLLSSNRNIQRYLLHLSSNYQPMLLQVAVPDLSPPTRHASAAPDRPTTSHEAQLIADSAAWSEFGSAVALRGALAIVGAPGDHSDVGAAFLFERSPSGTWRRTVKLSLSDGVDYDRFGDAVAIDSSGDIVVVGAHDKTINGSSSGAAYLFARNQGGAGHWGLVRRLLPADGRSGDDIGDAVAMSGDTVVVGAPYGHSSAGAVYLFERNQGGADAWGEVKTLIATDGKMNERFGEAVAMDGDTVVVGAPIHSINNVNGTGAVYVFARNQGGSNNWGLVKKIVASDGAIDDHFGGTVAIQGDTLVVGARDRDEKGANSGAVYLFGRQTGGANAWGQIKKLTGSDTAADDHFGQGIALLGDTLAIGAPDDDDSGDAAGALYLFSRNQGGANQWGQTKKLLPADTAAGDQFGAAVALDTSLLLSGSPHKNTGDYYAGAAYLFSQDQGGANQWGQLSKFIADDPTTGDNVGQSVAIGDELAVVGAPGDDEVDDVAGAAYLYIPNPPGTTNWKERKKLLPTETTLYPGFGEAVATSGNTFVVATEPIEEFGVAYVFERNQSSTEEWAFVKKLTTPTSGVGDVWDTTVAMDGDTIVLLTIIQDPDANFFIGADVFERNLGGTNHWGHGASLTSTDADPRNRFGAAIAIRGDLIAVGAYRNRDGGNAAGSVYLFGRNQGGANQWGQVKRLTPFFANTGGTFGRAIAISGDIVAVGAPDDATSANRAGAVYLFGRNQGGANQWGQVKKVLATDAAADDSFGAALELSGDALVVGAPYDDDNASNAGSVYVFGRKQGGADNWGLIAKITASDAAVDHYFGLALDSYKGRMIVGAPGVYNMGERAGAAYIYGIDPTLICYTLTISHSGSGSDPVVSPTSSLTCPNNQYTSGELITVNATPLSGWEVIQWTGTTNNASTANSNTVLMPTGDLALSVTYAQSCYQLSTTHSGSGADPVATPANSAGCAPGKYVAGERITLNATPTTGYQVSGWQGSDNDANLTTANTLTMPIGNRTVNVTYSQACYALTLTHTGAGADPMAAPTQSNGCPPGQYHYAEPINLSAAPAQGWRSSGWTGTANDSSTATSNALMMPATSHTVSVNYAAVCYQLTLAHSGTGADPVSSPAQSDGCPVHQYYFGTSISLNAQPSAGWQISSWSGTVNNAATTAMNSFAMPPNDHTVSVNYSEIPTAGPGDLYEIDDTCTRSRPIATDGSEVQEHTFHAVADADWVRFTTAAAKSYRIEVQTPADSLADVNLEVYAECEAPAFDSWNKSFSPGARIDLVAPASGQVYVRLANEDANQAGDKVRYTISVRALNADAGNRALILVAGRLKGADSLQKNIHNVTNAAYKLFQANGYTDENIWYLATDSKLPGYDAAVSKESLHTAITTWAKEKVGSDGVLNLYLMDHGSPETFYLDEVSGQRLTPDDLDSWLSELEAAVPNVKINIFIEACQSGSFITKPGSISKAGRVVITSSNAESDARASKDGAYFSDHLLTWLRQGYNLSAAFGEASSVARTIFSLQRSMLDADGNGVPNEFTDSNAAAKRSFAYAGSLANEWSPHIFGVQPPATITNFRGIIEADVRDDGQVRQVWAVVYPPDYLPPPTGQELQPEVLPTFLLTALDNGNRYAGEFTGFTQNGTYRILVHAEDNQGLVARPVVVEVNAGGRLYLPLILR